jgi:hypothetical protein
MLSACGESFFDGADQLLIAGEIRFDQAHQNLFQEPPSGLLILGRSGVFGHAQDYGGATREMNQATALLSEQMTS